MEDAVAVAKSSLSSLSPLRGRCCLLRFASSLGFGQFGLGFRGVLGMQERSFVSAVNVHPYNVDFRWVIILGPNYLY